MAQAPLQIKKATVGSVDAVPTGYVGFIAGSDGKFYAKDGSSDAVQLSTSEDVQAATRFFPSVLPSTLHDVKYAVASIRAVGCWSGKFWGVSANGAISSSVDGISWSQERNAATYSGIMRMYPTSDGEIMLLTGGQIYKSSGWSANKETATFSGKVTVTPGGFASLNTFGIDASPDGTKFILGEYAGVPGWATSRKVWISEDSGTTFNVVYDALIRYGSDNDNTHIHGVAYDPWRDRYWVSEGHSAPSGLYFSDDAGGTWTKCTGDYPISASPTTITATRDALVLGSDSDPSGVFVMPCFDDPSQQETADARLVYRWRESAFQDGIIGFALHGWRDPSTGIVYLGYQSSLSVSLPIVACDGRTAWNLHFIQETATPGVKHFNSFVLGNTYLADYVLSDDATRKRIVASVIPQAVSSVDDSGALEGRSASVSSVVVGRSTIGTATESVLVGHGSVINDGCVDSIAIGAKNTISHPRCVMVGTDLVSGGVDQIFMGTVTGSAPQQLGFGVSVSLANNTGAVGVGSGVTFASGASDSVAVGASISINGVQATAIGKSLDVRTQAVNIGYGNSVHSSSQRSVTVGVGISLIGGFAVCVGYGASGDEASTAIGWLSVTQRYGTAIGGNSGAVTNSVAVGVSAKGNHANSVALGYAIETSAAGQVCVGQTHFEMYELASDPAAPSANRARFYTRYNGSGKTQLCVRFATGAVQVIATEP